MSAIAISKPGGCERGGGGVGSKFIGDGGDVVPGDFTSRRCAFAGDVAAAAAAEPRATSVDP